MFEELLPIIEKNDSIVIFGHIYPDGDCYGSQIGLRELLKLNYPYKKVYAVGTGIRRFYSYLGKMDVVEDDVIKESLAILVDGNDCSRMEDQRVVTAKEFIKIDHHIENFRFTEGKFVLDSNANSTCELIVQFIQEAGWKVNPTICNALYLGLLTDSGRFQFIEDYPKAFHEAAFLCENGANPKQINGILNVTNEAAMRFKGYVFNNYKKTESGVIYLTFPLDILHELHVSPSKAGSMVNLLANVEGYPIWVFFYENEDRTCHAEFRCCDPLVVQPTAAKYGGGGHLQAAGAGFDNMSDETVQMVIEDLNQVVEEYKKGQK